MIFETIGKFIRNNFFTIAYFVFLWFIARESYSEAFNFHFWRDDWAWLWSSHYNPADFTRSILGPTWYLRVGPLSYFYVINLHQLITDAQIWQWIGFFLKLLNSLIFFVFVFTLTRKKYLAVLGSFLYASYSGGAESYVWYELSGLSTTFVLLGFIYYYKFLEGFSKRSFTISYVLFIISFLIFIGRSTGVIAIIVLWNALKFIDTGAKSSNKKRLLIYSSIAYVIPFLALSLYIRSVQKFSGNTPSEIISHLHLLLGNIGNLVR